MSTYVRQTPNLVVPATQNTAPVLEFRCLYTHDLRQKKKRWQDGLLRFHTFNKRVMVYDVSRNFIGDTYWREGEVVQDGEELQLEKGVMIQVGEAVGSMEQDLTALLERKKPAQDGSTTHNSSPRNTYASTATTTGAPSTLLRPKSLNALLGTPRGTLGRATLPNKSPYQERHSDNCQCHYGSPRAKKRKVEGQTGHTRGIPTEMKNNNKNWGLSLVTTTPPISLAPPFRKPVNAEVICIESENENLRPSTEQRTDAKAQPSTNVGASALDPARLNSTSHVSTSNIIEQGLFSKSTTSNAKSASGLECSPSATTIVLPKFIEQRLVNPLRFASSKPKKKLMYKDLLPRQSPFGPSPKSDDTPMSLGYRPVAKTARNRMQVEPTDDSSKSYQVQQERVEARLGFLRELESLQHIDISRSSDNSSLDASSTSNTDLQNMEPCSIAAKEGESVSGVGVGIEEAVSPAAVAAESEALSKIPGQGFTKSTAFSPSAVEMNKDEEDSDLSQMDQLLLSRQRVGNMKTKLFNSPSAAERVTAERQTEACKQITYIPCSKKLQEICPIVTISLRPQEMPFDLEVPAQQPPLRPSPPHPTIPTIPVLPASTKHPSVPSRQRSRLKKSFSETDNGPDVIRQPIKAPLQKSISDMTGVPNSFHSKQSEKLPIENRNLDLGPWSREAFDLFGWG